MIDLSIDATDVAIIFATIMGPVLAVQAQKHLESRRAVRDRRLAVYRALMATRASLMSPTHVEALNAVPVEFYGASKTLKDINDAWKLYLDHLGTQTTSGEIWVQRRADLLIDMLFLMSRYLGYDFSRSQLEKDVYSPIGHTTLETEQTIIRQGFASIFRGDKAFPMAVKEFPFSEADAEPAKLK